MSWIADKRGDVTGLRVERVVGIHSRLPPIQPASNSNSWRFGNLEKSKDRSKISSLPTSGDDCQCQYLATTSRTGGGGRNLQWKGIVYNSLTRVLAYVSVSLTFEKRHSYRLQIRTSVKHSPVGTSNNMSTTQRATRRAAIVRQSSLKILPIPSNVVLSTHTRDPQIITIRQLGDNFQDSARAGW